MEKRPRLVAGTHPLIWGIHLLQGGLFVPMVALNVLQKQFLMGEVLTIIKASRDRVSSQEHLRSRQERFKFLATQQQGPMVIDTYTTLDPGSSIIGYALFYPGSNGPLVIVEASISPFERAAVSAISDLTAKALDSASTPDGSRLYFLGIYDLDATQIIKTMVVKADTVVGHAYAVRYLVPLR